MKWPYALIIIPVLVLGWVGTGFRFNTDDVIDNVKLSANSFLFIVDPVVHLTLNRTVTKEYVLSKTKISYNYTFVHVYDSSATKFFLQELIINIPEDTTFYYDYDGWGYLYGGKRITEHAKFCNIPYDDLFEMAGADIITVYMCGEGYIY
ncbi:hypothetical protein LCGC14_2483920 [marine sediment metagenome]|uniref:Uncharacterized protein n=1 Tax=marine sediment metagenome TaxID=412755 RepID=A0A0F9BUI0_9ZZZZ